MASTDEWIIFIVILFVALGFVLPFVNNAFGESYTGTSSDVIKDKMSGSTVDPTDASIGFGDIFLSMVTIFFWTFGGVPTWLDIMLFIPLRIMLLILLYNKARGIS